MAIFTLVWGLHASPVLAQEEAKRYEDVTWNNVVLVDFHPGQTNKAMDIINDNFVAAARKADLPVPRMIEMKSGPWDLMLIWTMEEGPSTMEWEISPNGIKHQKAMVEVIGSKEEAKELWNEYFSLVDRSTSYIGFSGRHGSPITAKK